MNNKLDAKNTITKPEPLFYPDLADSKAYRIPSMITTLKGTIIAGIDARIVDSRDNPNEIDTTIRRSTDNGETWGSVQKLVSYPGNGLDGAAAIDTALLQDGETGVIWMVFCHTPGGVGLWNSEAGVGFDQDGRKILFDAENNQYSLGETGNVYKDGTIETSFTVDEEGYVFKDNVPCGNIYFKKGIVENESMLESRTSFLQIIKSEDDGLTWSEPVDLNVQVKESWMKFIGSGPGRGIQIKEGKYKGRLVLPIYFSNEHSKMSCAVIYSDDHGETWARGSSPNDGREFNGKLLSAEKTAEDNSDLTESQVIELPGGELRVYMRNHSGKQRTAVATSTNGGETWTDLYYDNELIDPTCQSTIIKYPELEDRKTRLVFVNPADPKHRKNGTVRLSEDGGKSWPYSKQIDSGSFIYSCLTVLDNGEIALLYESDLDENYTITVNFLKFTLGWIKS
ncbi:hypothetical protein CIL05_00465 [Virgibacillus profundi]|uniref:exo-alpha-sialidase n=1 Tax=Virgibacillus profundi TaxID=2024555 RepID=A0A2A2IIF9_9BACI|nr:sialidase family protein [Virgibacillus profundi]PAV31168.1 hypothetical protein CIL05_00465 [Virgibacillus profundi]PXY55351.1 exo-alpha-sialidase [Virgibacillus profundi]